IAVAAARLFAGLGSGMALRIIAVTLRRLGRSGRTTTLSTQAAPAASAARWHSIGPGPGPGDVHAGSPGSLAKPTGPTGRPILRRRLLAALGPRFVTRTVNATSWSARTVRGRAVTRTRTSALTDARWAPAPAGNTAATATSSVSGTSARMWRS